jgi:hypothetical protein
MYLYVRRRYPAIPHNTANSGAPSRRTVRNTSSPIASFSSRLQRNLGLKPRERHSCYAASSTHRQKTVPGLVRGVHGAFGSLSGKRQVRSGTGSLAQHNMLVNCGQSVSTGVGARSCVLPFFQLLAVWNLGERWLPSGLPRLRARCLRADRGAGGEG